MTNQRGNVLFFILIAVGLFAALSYAFTQSTRVGEATANKDVVRAQLSSILQHLANIDNAVMRLRLINNVSIEEVSFRGFFKRYSGEIITYNINPRCTTNKCLVFHKDGGALAPIVFSSYGASPANMQPNWPAPGQFVLVAMKFPDAGTDANDIVMNLKYIKPEICDELNRMQNITDPVTFNGVETYAFAPSTWDSAGFTISSDASQLSGKKTFAATYGGTGEGRYCGIFHLIHAR